MPAYNAALYLRPAIESILRQSFTNFEFLIINDGSKDDTLAIARSYSDQRIRIISQDNKGLIDTLNMGIAEAKAPVIARMDADDISHANRLEAQISFLKDHPDYILLGSEANIIDKEGDFVFRLLPPGFEHQEIVKAAEHECPFIHPSVMFVKQAVIDAGGYPKNALTFEDHLLWKKMLSVGKGYNMKQVLVDYRFNPGSVTIDEKWRGKEFREIRQRAIANGYVPDGDAEVLRRIISSQNIGPYKTAAYHATMAKKYLWTNPDNKKARYNLAQAIKSYPQNIESYILYAFALLPSKVRVGIYKMLKG